MDDVLIAQKSLQLTKNLAVIFASLIIISYFFLFVPGQVEEICDKRDNSYVSQCNQQNGTLVCYNPFRTYENFFILNKNLNQSK